VLLMSSPLLLSTRIQEGYFAPAYRATLLYFYSARRLILRSFAYVKVFSFMQDLGCFDGIPWANSWTNGQIVDKKYLGSKATLLPSFKYCRISIWQLLLGK
jgi:hypothetical protein